MPEPIDTTEEFQDAVILEAKNQQEASVKSIMAEQKRGVGRPTVMTEEVVRVLIVAFQMGFNDSTACKKARISRETFYKHLAENATFADRIADAKSFIKFLAGKRLIKLLKDGSDRDVAGIIKWVLEHKERDEYGPIPLVQADTINIQQNNLISAEEATRLMKEEFERENGDNATNAAGMAEDATPLV